MNVYEKLSSLVNITTEGIDAALILLYTICQDDKTREVIAILEPLRAGLTTFEIITDEQRENMIVGAIEGGSNYWYYLGDEAMDIIEKYKDKAKKENTLTEMFWRAIKAGETIPVNDAENENEKLGEINTASIKLGERLLLEKQPDHFQDIIDQTDDSITADVWFQMASLGAILFG